MLFAPEDLEPAGNKSGPVHFEIPVFHQKLFSVFVYFFSHNRGKLISTILDWEDALPDRDLNKADDASR